MQQLVSFQNLATLLKNAKDSKHSLYFQYRFIFLLLFIITIIISSLLPVNAIINYINVTINYYYYDQQLLVSLLVLSINILLFIIMHYHYCDLLLLIINTFIILGMISY